MARPHPIFNSLLRNRTRELLKEHLKLKAHTYLTISNDTNLSPTWVAMFDRGEINHTDVGRVETLYNYLSPLPLEV